MSPILAPKPSHTGSQRSHATPLLLLFASRTSGQARRVEGFVAHILQRRHNHGSFRFVTVWDDERPDFFDQLAVDIVPTLLVVEDKQIKARRCGVIKPAHIEEMLAPWLH